jgi:hypothetical protein
MSATHPALPKVSFWQAKEVKALYHEEVAEITVFAESAGRSLSGNVTSE